MMRDAYVRPSAIPDGAKDALVGILLHQELPASGCELVPHDSPRQALDFGFWAR